MENYKIYALKLKDSNDIRYIGLTKKSLEERFKKHLRDTIKRNTKNGNWIKKYKDNIEIILIEENINDVNIISEREIFWIKYYTDLGYNLTNGTLGGFKGEPTEETCKKLSESQKGKTISDETKEKIRNTLTGRKQTDEHINNVIMSKISYTHSEDTKKKIGDGNRNKPQINSKKFEVYNYKTNEFIGIFETQTECARTLKIYKSGISDVLSGRYKQHKGYYFILIE